MRPSKQKRVDRRKMRSVASRSTLAKTLAPEEVRPGDFVALLHVIAELPSFLWNADGVTMPLQDLVRIQFVPEDGGMPMKVKSVCLPFVLVKLPAGKKQSLDIRICRLARLDPEYAAVIWKAHRKARGKRKRKAS